MDLVGAPQVGFSTAIGRSIPELPATSVFSPPVSWPWRSVASTSGNRPGATGSTVSGVTTISDGFHPDQNRRKATQKTLSSRPILGFGCRRFSTASCWRNARFSRRRLRRARKRRTSVPRDRTTNRNIARIYSRTVAVGRQVCY